MRGEGVLSHKVVWHMFGDFVLKHTQRNAQIVRY